MDIFASDKAFLTCLKKYGVFKGRAGRPEFWYFFLVYNVITLICSIIPILAAFGGIITLALFLPYLAVTVRRLHDTGRSGKWVFLQFIGLVPLVIGLLLAIPSIIDFFEYGYFEVGSAVALACIIIGGIATIVTNIVLIVFLAQPTQQGENKYGPEPASPSAGFSSSKKADADELQKMKKLLDDGVITQEDYDKKKKELLGL